MNTETPKPKPGRPKLQPEQKKSERIAIYLTPALAQEVQRRGGSAYVERTIRRHVAVR